MSTRVECIGSRSPEACYNRSPKIDRLPQEFLDEIFSHLSKYDLQASEDISRSISGSVKANDLRDHGQFPHSQENVIELAAFEKLIDTISHIPCRDERSSAFDDISVALVQAGFVDRSIEVASSIDEEYTRSFTLWKLSKLLTQAGDFDRAMTTATSIVHEYRRIIALRYVSKALTLVDDFDRAITAAKSITTTSERLNALKDNFLELMKTGDIGRAITFAESIPDKFYRKITLKNIFIELIHTGKVDTATRIAHSFSNDEEKARAHKIISKIEANAGNLSESFPPSKEEFGELQLRTTPQIRFWESLS